MRAADEKACAFGELARKEAERALKESIRTAEFDLNELEKGSDRSIITSESPAQRGGSTRGAGSSMAAGPPPIFVSTKPQPPPVLRSSRPTQWTCATCTLEVATPTTLTLMKIKSNQMSEMSLRWR